MEGHPNEGVQKEVGLTCPGKSPGLGSRNCHLDGIITGQEWMKPPKKSVRRGRGLNAQNLGTLSQEEPTQTNQRSSKMGKKGSPEGRQGSYRKGKAPTISDTTESSGRGKGEATGFGNLRLVADPSRVGSPPRLGRRPDCCRSSRKWEK